MKFNIRHFTAALVISALSGFAPNHAQAVEFNPFGLTRVLSHNQVGSNFRVVFAAFASVNTGYVANENCYDPDANSGCGKIQYTGQLPAVRVVVEYDAGSYDNGGSAPLIEFYVPASNISKKILNAAIANPRAAGQFFTVRVRSQNVFKKTLDSGSSEFCLDSDGRPLGGVCKEKMVYKTSKFFEQVVSLGIRK